VSYSPSLLENKQNKNRKNKQSNWLLEITQKREKIGKSQKTCLIKFGKYFLNFKTQKIAMNKDKKILEWTWQMNVHGIRAVLQKIT